jgi:hypothetical protein
MTPTPQTLHGFTPFTSALAQEAATALAGVIAESQRNVCPHEETYRGGVLWEICSACGTKWADDEGGRPEYKEPAAITRAEAVLASLRAAVAAPEQPASTPPDFTPAEWRQAVFTMYSIGRTSPAAQGIPSHVLEAMRDLLLAQAAPIPMILHCPDCGHQHIDKPEPRTGWKNEPHRTHKCGACGTHWRPADVLTTGVASIQTRGTTDTWPRVRA